MAVVVAVPGFTAVPLQSGLDTIVQRYSGHGPLIAAFLAFGLVLLGLMPKSFLFGVLATLLVLGIGGLLRGRIEHTS